MRSKTIRSRLLLPALTCLLFHAPVGDGRAEAVEQKAGSTSTFSLHVSTEKLEPGEIMKVSVEGADVSDLYAEGTFGEQELIFHPGSNGQSLFSLAGADLEIKPGPVPLTVLILKKDGQAEVLRREIQVSEKEFDVQKLYLEEKEYTPELLERIRREGDMFKSLWKTTTPERLWQESFEEPLSSITVTSDFGLRRLINDVPRRSHTGVDLRAAAGDTIFAPNNGRVVLSGDFYFNGKTVVLDHGEGFYSMYFHLSTGLTEDGENVRRGEPIGLVGSTGRSTAPHLHWGIILRGARLDPLKILDLPI